MTQKKVNNFLFAFLIFCFFDFESYNLNASQIANNNKNYERSWVQFIEDDKIAFRAIFENIQTKCPIIKFDNEEFQTSERRHSYLNDFPIKICQATFENDKKNHVIKYNKNIIKINPNINKISNIGDTGCVVKKNNLTGKSFEQDCNDIDKYPFKLNSEAVASHKPDVTIHVGDYYYTQNECEDSKKCLGRAFGDKFLTWRIDFLDNAETLFSSAPMIFLRGNHEKCDRGGKGWAVFFDASINFKECSEYDKAFKVKFNNIDFFIIDSAYAEDIITKNFKNSDAIKQIEFYSNEFSKLLNDIDKKKYNAILTHRPIFAFEYEAWKKNKTNTPEEMNLVLGHSLMSISPSKLKHLDFIISGHIHMGATISIKNNKKHLNVKQIISGNGGANLNTGNHYVGQKRIFKQNKVKSYSQFNSFGFADITLNDEEIKFYDYKNNLQSQN